MALKKDPYVFVPEEWSHRLCFHFLREGPEKAAEEAADLWESKQGVADAGVMGLAMFAHGLGYTTAAIEMVAHYRSLTAGRSTNVESGPVTP